MNDFYKVRADHLVPGQRIVVESGKGKHRKGKDNVLGATMLIQIVTGDSRGWVEIHGHDAYGSALSMTVKGSEKVKVRIMG